MRARIIVEAVAASAVGAIQRKGIKVGSLVSDLKRKKKYRAMMKSREATPMATVITQSEIVNPNATAPAPVEQAELRLNVKEDVNYRYAEDPDKSCGTCQYFIEPGSCQIVAGLIRHIDVCNEFTTPDHDIGDALPPNVVQSELLRSNYESVKPPVVEGFFGDMFPDDEEIGDCDDWERDDDGNCPSDEFDDNQVEATLVASDDGLKKLWDTAQRSPSWKSCLTKAANEASPPGWEGTILRMKKHPEIDNPWALSWWMSNQGYSSHAGPRGGKKEGVEGGPGSGPQKSKWVKADSPDHKALVAQGWKHVDTQTRKNPRGSGGLSMAKLVPPDPKKEGGPGSGPQKGGGRDKAAGPGPMRPAPVGWRPPPSVGSKGGPTLKDRMIRNDAFKQKMQDRADRKFEKPKPASDEDKQIQKFTRRETPQVRAERIAKMRVDPATATAMRRALLVVRATLAM